MNERELLFRSILADPTDPVPRLVFADWLEEHGDEDRATFIRLGYELVLLGDNPEAFDVALRERALLERHSTAWKADLPEPVRDYCGFRMGFVHHLAVGGLEWAEYGRRVCEVTPLESLHLTYPLMAAAQAPPVGRVTRLSLLGWGRQEFHAILESPLGEHLRELVFPENGFDDGRASILADWNGFSRLESLEAHRHFLTRDGLAALLDSPHSTRLRSLDLSSGSLDDSAVRLLAIGSLPSLTTLRLNHCGRISIAALRLLFASEARAGLEELSLRRTAISDAELAILADGPLRALRTLRLYGYISRIGIQAMALSESLSSLRVLEIGSPRLDDACCAALGQSPRLTALHDLALPDAKMTDRGAFELAFSERLSNLRILRVPSDRITSRTIDVLRERFGSGLVLLNRSG